MLPRAPLLTLVLIFFFVGTALSEQDPPQNHFTFIAAEIAEKANVWLPSVLVVNKDETVHLQLRNVSERDHGFTIKGLGIREVVPPGGKIRVKISASSQGVYRLYCHLHKGHVGGQILVQ